MAVIEITAFELASGADEQAFLVADKRLQTDVLYQHAGLLRRTTARADRGGWVVVVVWRSPADAQASKRLAEQHPDYEKFMAFVAGGSLRSKSYTTVD